MNVKIEKLVYGGDGLAHHEGHTVFVPFVLPEEVVAVRPIERKKKFIRGRAQHIVTASPRRMAPPCTHFTVCGGCHYQHIGEADQLKYKKEILRETLSRLGRVKWEGEIQTHASPPLGYRNRAQWKIRPGLDGRPAIGYFRAGSAALCAVDECPILAPKLAETLDKLRSLLRQGRLPGTLREVEAFADGSGRQLLINAALAGVPDSPEAVASLLRTALPGTETILLHDTSRDRFELFGPGFIHYTVASHSYHVGHLSFFQINRFLVEEMVQAVAAEPPGATAVELYAGIGLFTVPLAAKFERVAAVESNAAAARDLSHNVAEIKDRVQIAGMDVEEYLKSVTETPNLVLLDPPRAGLTPAVREELKRLQPARITYFSCDPSTLARDLAALLAEDSGASYEIVEVHLYDVFPQTYHLESLVQLRRRA